MQFTLSHLSRLKEQEKYENCCAQYEKSIKINQAGVNEYYSKVYEANIHNDGDSRFIIFYFIFLQVLYLYTLISKKSENIF